MSHLPTIEQQLVAASQDRGGNARFVRQTMQAIEKQAASNAFSQALGNAAESRQSWKYKLSHLPKALLISLIIIGCAIASGTAYAAYMVWLSPSAHVRSTAHQYGRDQALIELKNCYGASQKVTVEITNNSGGTPEEAAKELEANCEIQAIQSWAIQRFHTEPSQMQFAFLFDSLGDSTLTVKQYETQAIRRFTSKKNLPVVYQGKVVPSSTLRPGSTVAVIASNDGKTVLALVRLTHQASVYTLSPQTANAYHQRDTCVGNSDASCIQLPNLDVLRSGEGGDNPNAPGDGREIQGKVVSISTAQFVIEATSGKHYTVHTDGDPIGVFNASNPYGTITIVPGDVIMVLYRIPPGDNTQDIQATQYQAIQLMLQGFDKKAAVIDDTLKYHY